MPGIEHKIVDPVTLAELPVGDTGELWLRGYSLMLGLHKRERADTFTADGWYRTGDSGYFDDDGHFYFTGRMGDLIKSSGMNVTPRDVELALEELPEVVMAFVCGVEHPDRGQDVVAAIALQPGPIAHRGRSPSPSQRGAGLLQGAQAHRGVRRSDAAARGSTRARSTADA